MEERKASIPFCDIEADTSPSKVTSHVRLQQYVEKYGEGAFAKSFSKVQLQSLCKSYGLQVSARATKTKLVQDLLPLLRAGDKMSHPYYTNVLQSQVNLDEANHRITLRISRAD